MTLSSETGKLCLPVFKILGSSTLLTNDFVSQENIYKTNDSVINRENGFG